MHLETLLYMLLQSDKTLPPTANIPDFQAMARTAKAARVPNKWFQIPEQTISVGLDDPEDNSGGDRHFGWYVILSSGNGEKLTRKGTTKSQEGKST